MGIFDSIKNVFGGSEGAEEATVSPSQMLRDAGVDPTGLKFGFGSDGGITVSGEISTDTDRQKIIDVLSSAPGVNSVVDEMTVTVEDTAPAEEAASKVSEETAASDEAAAESTPGETAGRTYTVQSGDTLWKISQEMYGNGSQYMKIFEANTDLLDDPDRIFPGQELVIPD